MRLLILLPLLTGCAASLARRPCDIVLTSAVIGPSNTAGERWDGLGTVPPELRAAAIAAVSGMDPSVGLVVADIQAFAAAVEPPDAAGRMEFGNEYAEDARKVEVKEASDTYTPSWTSAPPTVSGVRITPGSQLKLVLDDIDTRFDNPDPLGTIVIDRDTLVKAWRNKAPYAVDVSGQTGGQVLTVNLRVVRD